MYKYQFMAQFIGLNDKYGITDPSEPENNITYFFQSATIPGYELTTASAPFFRFGVQDSPEY